MEKGKEQHVISPMDAGPYISKNVLEVGYGKIDAEALINKTKADRLLPREKLNYFASSVPPISRQKGIEVKENLV